jgi:hypothetical protein
MAVLPSLRRTDFPDIDIGGGKKIAPGAYGMPAGAESRDKCV